MVLPDFRSTQIPMICQGPSKAHTRQVWFLMVQWFQIRIILKIFSPQGPMLNLCMMAAILDLSIETQKDSL